MLNDLASLLRHYLRETGMFVVGAAGFIHEVFLVQPPAERPFLIAASMGLMGLPFVLAGDTKLRGGNGSFSPPAPPHVPPPVPTDEERRAAERARRRAELQAELDALDSK